CLTSLVCRLWRPVRHVKTEAKMYLIGRKPSSTFRNSEKSGQDIGRRASQENRGGGRQEEAARGNPGDGRGLCPEGRKSRRWEGVQKAFTYGIVTLTARELCSSPYHHHKRNRERLA